MDVSGQGSRSWASVFAGALLLCLVAAGGVDGELGQDAAGLEVGDEDVDIVDETADGAVSVGAADAEGAQLEDAGGEIARSGVGVVGRRVGTGFQGVEASFPVAGQEYLDPAPGDAVASCRVWSCCVCRPQPPSMMDSTITRFFAIAHRANDVPRHHSPRPANDVARQPRTMC